MRSWKRTITPSTRKPRGTSIVTPPNASAVAVVAPRCRRPPRGPLARFYGPVGRSAAPGLGMHPLRGCMPVGGGSLLALPSHEFVAAKARGCGPRSRSVSGSPRGRAQHSCQFALAHPLETSDDVLHRRSTRYRSVDRPTWAPLWHRARGVPTRPSWASPVGPGRGRLRVTPCLSAPAQPPVPTKIWRFRGLPVAPKSRPDLKLFGAYRAI